MLYAVTVAAVFQIHWIHELCVSQYEETRMVYESNHYAWISICSWNDSGHTKTKQSYRQTGIVVRLNAVFLYLDLLYYWVGKFLLLGFCH